MKRFILAALVGTIFVAAPVSAQTIGFKVGGTYSKTDVDDPDGAEPDWMSGLGVGGFIRFGLAGLALQVDVLGVTKGAEVVDAQDGDVNFELEYVEVPVQLVFSLGASRFSPYLMAGPSFAFETGCEVEFDQGPGDEEGVDCDNADFFDRKSTDIGLTGAAGLQIPLGPGALLIEGRYTHGLTNIDDSQGDAPKVRNRSFGLFAGYSISLGR